MYYANQNDLYEQYKRYIAKIQVDTRKREEEEASDHLF